MILTDSQQKSNWIRFILTAIVFFTVSMFAFGFPISKSRTFKCENNIKHEENANNATIHLDQTTPYTLIYDTRVSDPTDLTIEISLGGLSPNVTVDWGDGSPLESFTTTGFKPHTYATDGIYTVQISGSLSAPKGYDNTPHLEELVEIVDWGDTGWTSFHSIGAWAENLVAVPNSIPSSVTDLSHCFYFAKVFNQNISSWDVSNVTNMRSMFNGAFVFNQPLNSWDVSTVTDMGGMFMNTNAFNQPLNSWDVGDVTNMSNMFSFNANFNQNINNWDVGNVTHMSAMFYVAGVFNQPLDNWDVDNVTDMRWMFRSTGVFNQDISNWNVSNVSDMSWMFHNSRAFDQNIGSWDMSSVTNVAEMFSNSALSTSNYDQILIGWSSQNLNQNLTFYSSASYSCTAAAARQQIINNYGWTINDAGLSDNVPPTAIAQNIARTLDANGNVSVMASSIDNGSTDDCGGSLTFELARDFNGDGTADSSFVNNLGFDCTFTGTNNVVLRVTDAAGNSSTATATIAISDDTNPAVSTQNITVFLDNNGAASIVPLDIDNNSSDNCGIQSLSLNTTSFDCSNLGTNTVTLTATDLNGNTSTTNALVTVADNTAPEITLLGDNPLTITEGDPYNEPGATATDNCSVTISNLTITGAVDNNTVGSYTISYEINDDAGNAAATITRTVEVLEDTRPTGPAQQTFCEGATLADVSVTGTNIQWYDAASGGNTLSMSTALINGMTVYATQTINGVESTNRLEVSVTVLQPSTITASGGVTVAGNNGQIVVVDGAIVVQSPQNIDGLRVYIGGFQSGDELFINSSLPTGVSANYNNSNGVLEINGTLTPQEAQTLLRSITFRTISANLTDREISFSLGSSIPFTGNGHFYEFVVNQGISWTDALTAANNSNYYGMPGYLVTITSAAENAHVSTLLQGQGWIGASDQAVEGEWRWMNGPEAGTQFWQGNGSGSAVGGNYENWSGPAEPNNLGEEDYGHFFTNGTWND